MLASSDAELGTIVDAEFTRPGIEALLDKLGETLASVEYSFKWK